MDRLWVWVALAVLLIIAFLIAWALTHPHSALRKMHIIKFLLVAVLVLPAMAQNCSPIYPGYVGIPLIDAPTVANFEEDVFLVDIKPIIMDPIRVETANQMMLSVEGNLLWNSTGNHTDLLNGTKLLEAGHMAFWNETNA